MILADKSDDDSYDLTGSIDDDGYIFRILGEESDMDSSLFESLQSHFTIE